MSKKEIEELEQTGSDKQQISSVVRTITILERLARHKSINLEQLAKETELPKATLLRFLSTLASLGYVYRDPGDRYSLTLKMFSVGSHGLEHLDLINLAQPIAELLCENLGETVHMGILEDDHAVYVLKKESSYTLRMYSRVGKMIPLYCTAIGKILLSDMSEQEVEEYLAGRQLKPFTPKTLRTPEAVKAELAAIRARGWAMDDEEHEQGIMCIGAPVRDYTGKVIAAMSVSWPLFRFERKGFDLTVEMIKQACGRLSELLGWEPEKQ
ncbi:MAG: IclR family transcriptional regulator [Sphaerochaetaceae bacterium]|nr:IclR family transcriptional regulator [Sphaerochaetaceae bacterium]